MKTPSYRELWLIIILGALQPAIEFFYGSRVSTNYNVAVSLLVVGYVLAVVVRYGRPALRTWGFRTDNFLQCLPPYALCTLVAGIVLFAYGHWMGTTPLPHGFWIVLFLYPIWGIAQQFVLQNFLARNLVEVLPNPLIRACCVAVLFAAAHIPSRELFVVAGLAGFAFTWLYNRYPNLFVLGIAHGILGALVFHLVLGQDQWLILREYFLT